MENLEEENRRLRAAIEKHREQSGHALCWLNDVELWSVLGPAQYPHASLPVREEFLKQCARYHESRLTGTPYAEPSVKKTIVD